MSTSRRGRWSPSPAYRAAAKVRWRSTRFTP
ncbi:UNVERIFIED_CONTAM: hypothetical protein GTU68_034044 [Idotea baltica]|nr:hypothetical protein [Idotea baltica]